MLTKCRRKIYDEYNDEEVQITKEEAKIISRMLKGKTPHANVDPYPVCTTVLIIFYTYLLLVTSLDVN